MFEFKESSSTGCGVVGVCASKDGEAWDGKFDIAMTDLGLEEEGGERTVLEKGISTKNDHYR